MNTRQLLGRVSLSFLLTAALLKPSFAYPKPQATARDYEVAMSLQRVFESVAAKVRPTVVDIVSVSVVKFQHPPIPPDLREFFKEFGMPFPFPELPQEFERRSLGSGFIVMKKGDWAYILTNNHVVAKAKDVKVKLYDGSVYKGYIVGKDPKTDVALLKIKVGKKKVPIAKLGDSSKIKVGEIVIAIGNPYRLDGSVTHGIISATGRHGLGLNPVENFIQTDAAINPGNSGGPLCDLHGRVIGINTAIIANAQGLGFAVPINIAKLVMQDLLKYGKVIRGWLGVYIQDVSPEVAQKFGIKGGVLVTKVIKGSPAEHAGIKSGDIIVEFDGSKVKNAADLQLKVMKTKPGTEVKVVVIRNGRRKTLNVRIGQMPSETQLASLMSTYGFSVQKLTPELKEKLGIPDEINGVVVTNVQPGSPASDGGLEEGDVIVAAGTDAEDLKPVRKPQDLAKIAKKAGSQGLLLKVYRDGFWTYVVINPNE